MENFNLKNYVYEKRAEGLTNARIAETLGIQTNELRQLLEQDGKPMDEKKDLKTDEVKKPVKTEGETKKVSGVASVDETPKEKTKEPYVKPDDDLSWME